MKKDYRRRDSETNLYSQMSASFGILGLVSCYFCFIPPWMIFCVRKKIRDHKERWAVGIVFITVFISMLLSITNQNINYLEANWIYMVYLGIMVSVALRYGYVPYNVKSWFWGIGGLILTIIFIVGTYHTTFGLHGYQGLRKELIARITHGYKKDAQVIIWDNKKRIGMTKFSNRLIKTRGNPYRIRYTVNRFRMNATSDPLRMRAPSNLFCIRTSITQKSKQERFELGLKVLVNGRDMRARNRYMFYSSGEKILYYYVPNIENKEVKIRVKVGLVRALPYHEDYRTEVDQKRYMPYHKEYGDLGVTISVVPFIKTLPQNADLNSGTI